MTETLANLLNNNTLAVLVPFADSNSQSNYIYRRQYARTVIRAQLDRNV